MFNVVTEDIIRKIPHIDGIKEQELPQFLSRTYARIISLKTKYPEGVFQFQNEELQKDIEDLALICNTLELFLVSGQQIDNRKSVAFVSALGRKFISMVETKDDILSIFYIPSKLYTALLFLISGNFSDADEISGEISYESESIAHQFIKSIHLISGGKLHDLKKLSLIKPEATPTIQYVESLLFNELISGVKDLGECLLTGAVFDEDVFSRVKRLSVNTIDIFNANDIYAAPFLLSGLLIEASRTLISHSLFQIGHTEGLPYPVWKDTIRKLASRRPYLWDNHLKAINLGVLKVGVSSVVTFPTGSGKTTLSELKIASTLIINKKVLYLVPTHALEHQVRDNLNSLWENIVVDVVDKDGEFSILDENDGRVLVMTPEKCLTLLELSPERLSDVGLVVFDEFHMISSTGENRRAFDAMTVVIELLDIRPNADYLFLSAMVSNGQQIANWIGHATGRPCLLLDDLWKPTCQLQGCIVYDNHAIKSLINRIEQEHKLTKKKGPSSAFQRSTTIIPKCLFSLKAVWDTENFADYYHVDISDWTIQLSIDKNSWKLNPNGNEVAVQLARKFASIGLKCLIFVQRIIDSNSNCKKVNSLLSTDHLDVFLKKFNRNWDRIAIELGDSKYSFLNICRSATIHHSDMIEDERFISEQYFKHSDGVNIMIATPTVSQGINLPADIVLIVGNERYDKTKGRIAEIDAHEILNAAGRAGRAGFRSQGAAILIPSKVLSMEGHSVDKVWMEIKDGIFSKGDHCLEITDPYQSILETKANYQKDLFSLRFVSNSESVARKLGKTLYVSKLYQEGKAEMASRSINAFVNELNNYQGECSWIDEIASKNGYPKDIISSFAFYVHTLDIEALARGTVTDIYHALTDWSVNNYEEIMRIFGNSSLFYNLPSLLKEGKEKKEFQDISIKDIKRLLDFIEDYINGYTYEEIEIQIAGAPSSYLEKARRLILKIIPSFSYVCGIFSQVIIACLTTQGKESLIEGDLKSFASCVREGVTSLAMLKFKYKNRCTRVEAHRDFKS